MKSLDDFGRFIYPGKHLRIPKSKVVHPENDGWEKVMLYLPMKGSVCSYRKGRLHVHDIDGESCWDLHMDKVDPQEDPVGHVVKDAPILIYGAAALTASAYLLSKLRRRSR